MYTRVHIDKQCMLIWKNSKYLPTELHIDRHSIPVVSYKTVHSKCVGIFVSGQKMHNLFAPPTDRWVMSTNWVMRSLSCAGSLCCFCCCWCNGECMTLRRTFEKCCCCFYSCCSYCSSSCRRQFGSCHFNLNAQIESSEWGRQRVKSKKQNRDLKIQLNCCCAASNVLGERGIGGNKKCTTRFSGHVDN